MWDCRSDDHLLDASGSGVGVECAIDGLLAVLGAGGLSHMHGTAVLAPEGGGDALLSFEDGAQRVPACVFTGLAQAAADGLHQLVGDHGDEEVAVGALLGAVEDGAQAELGLERAEDGLDIGERGVAAPQRLLVPVVYVGAQTVDAGVGLKGLAGPASPVRPESSALVLISPNS